MSEARRPDTPFWVEPEAVQDDRLRLTPEESHHLLHVHRAAPGTPFEATDGQGHLYECLLEAIDRRAAVGRILERRIDSGELSRRIFLIAGLPDWGAAEQLVTLAVPLGAASIDLVACERSERAALSAARIARLVRMARAGLKQSRRSRMPRIVSSAGLPEALEPLPPGPRLLADPGGEKSLTRPKLSLQDTVVLSVGPPGGFSERETRLLREANFEAISLGPSRLTTEAATLVLLSIARIQLS